MKDDHLAAVLITLVVYALLSGAYFGWGKALLFMTGSRRGEGDLPVTLSIWLGWAGTLFLFQLVHCVLPLTVHSVGPVFAAGLALMFLLRLPGQGPAIAPPLSTVTWAAIIAVLMLASIWVVERAMLPPTNFDSGLYHFNTIRWINSFPIVAGLGNLHGRLAFNQSFFVYAAALNFSPLFDHGRSLANSFLLLLTVGTLVELSLPVIKQPALAGERHPLLWSPGLFCLPMVVYWAISSDGLGSPSPDLTSSLLQLVIFILFGRAVATCGGGGTISGLESFVIAVLAATAITVKLSNLIFCGTVGLLILGWVMKSSEKRIADAVSLLLPVLLILLLWCGRGVVLSGAPLYPSTIGYVQTEWSVPVDKVIAEANAVHGWARQPRSDLQTVMGSWRWLAPWSRRMAAQGTEVLYPLGAFLVFSMIGAGVRFCGKTESARPLTVHGTLLLPLAAGLIFWFLAAPEPRFANALFLLLPVAAIQLGVGHVRNQITGRGVAILVGTLFIAGNLNLFHWAYRNRITFGNLSCDGWYPVKRVPLDRKVTKTGLQVYVPYIGAQGWDAPLPCTPYFNRNLRLRNPADISSGFSVRDAGSGAFGGTGS